MSIYYPSTPGLKMTGPQTNMTRSTGNQIFDCLFDPIQDTILWIMSHSILKERLTKISRSKNISLFVLQYLPRHRLTI